MLWNLTFDMSSDSDVRKLCLLEELFHLITIISNNSHLYSTDIDASVWFNGTIIKTVNAIFPRNDYESWFKHTFLSKLHKPQSKCGRQIVDAYKADDKKNSLIPTPQAQNARSHGILRHAVPGNETEEG